MYYYRLGTKKSKKVFLKLFFLSGPAFTKPPPPLSGRTIKKKDDFFAASLRNKQPLNNDYESYPFAISLSSMGRLNPSPIRIISKSLKIPISS